MSEEQKKAKKQTVAERIRQLEIKVAVLEEKVNRMSFQEKLIYILLAVAFGEIVLRVLGLLR
jgi:cell division protein FtsL